MNNIMFLQLNVVLFFVFVWASLCVFQLVSRRNRTEQQVTTVEEHSVVSAVTHVCLMRQVCVQFCGHHEKSKCLAGTHRQQTEQLLSIMILSLSVRVVWVLAVAPTLIEYTTKRRFW
jgi:hypothetical protein